MEIKINLLPWREEAYLEGRRHFMHIIAVLLLICLTGFFFSYRHLVSKLEKYEKRRSALQNSLLALKVDYQKTVVMQEQAKKLATENSRIGWLRQEQNIKNRMLARVIALTPSQILLRSISGGEKVLSIRGGITKNPKALGLFLGRLKEEKYLDTPKIEKRAGEGFAIISTIKSS